MPDFTLGLIAGFCGGVWATAWLHRPAAPNEPPRPVERKAGEIYALHQTYRHR